MIDIIVPVYNTPKKDLLRCLDSIKNQTYRDFNTIIIDDGSNETVRNILDDYCKQNQRFTVKHISNGGVSNARNIGLELSTSDYLTFVDADDEVLPSFLEEALKILEDNNLDMIVGGYEEIKDNEVIRTRLCEQGLHIYEGKDKDKYFDKLLSGKLSKDNKEIKDAPTGRIYTRLYRRSAIKILFNKNVKISEDTLFVIDLMKHLNRIGVIDRIWYKYYANPYSIVHQEFKQEQLNNLLAFLNEIYLRMLNESNPRIKNAYRMRIFKTCADIKTKLLNIDRNIFNKELFINSFKDLDLSNYINIKDHELAFYNEAKAVAKKHCTKRIDSVLFDKQ